MIYTFFSNIFPLFVLFLFFIRWCCGSKIAPNKNETRQNKQTKRCRQSVSHSIHRGRRCVVMFFFGPTTNSSFRRIPRLSIFRYQPSKPASVVCRRRCHHDHDYGRHYYRLALKKILKNRQHPNINGGGRNKKKEFFPLRKYIDNYARNNNTKKEV